jgi:hypothetical protein
MVGVLTGQTTSKEKKLSKQDIKDLRHGRKLSKDPPGPVEIKGNKLIIDPEKINDVFFKNNLSIENQRDKFNLLFDKNNGIDIEKLILEKKYPLRIDVKTNKPHPLRFILIPDSDPLSYQLASNQKIEKKDMIGINMPEHMEGTIDNKKKHVNLVNFKLKYKKVFEGDIKKPYNFFNVIDDIRNPMYVLQKE